MFMLLHVNHVGLTDDTCATFVRNDSLRKLLEIGTTTHSALAGKRSQFPSASY
jgi:hypothetical protein